MRLTLRTLLAWLDDTLPPSQVREIGKQVHETPYARDLIERIHRVSRQRRHTVPSSSGPEATDPNIVASYVDNNLDPEQVAEYEKKCLNSDVNLAEVASVHQILSLLGQKVHVPAEAKARMNQLVRGRESIPPPRPDGVKPPAPEPVTKPIQPWVAPEPPPRHWVERFGPAAACLALIGILSWSAYESLRPVSPEGTTLGVLQPPLAAPAIAHPGGPGATEPKEAHSDLPAPAATQGGAGEETLPKEVLAPSPAIASAPAPAETSKESSEAGKKTESAPEPGATPAAPSRAVPAGAIGVVDKSEGILLRYSTEKREWERLAEGALLGSADRLLCLAPFRARIVVAKAPITLLGETQLRMANKNAGEPPAIELTEGRVLVDPSAPAGNLKVEFSGRTVTIERPSQCSLGLERSRRWVYGQTPTQPPSLAIHASEGELHLAMDQAKETLTGPGTIAADPSGRFQARVEKTPPAWFAEGEPSLKDRRLGEQFFSQFTPGGKLMADIVVATESESPVTKKLAIFGLKALGDLSFLTPILSRAGDPSARESAAAALRSYHSQGPEARKRLREKLDEEFGAQLGQLIEKLLVGYTPEEAAGKATLQLLVDDLSPRNQSLVVRELALDNLKTITGRAVQGYDPENPDDKGYNGWKSLINSKEELKPAAKRKASG
jgi:hypothetical protein